MNSERLYSSRQTVRAKIPKRHLESEGVNTRFLNAFY
jgi:hypothetical protein